MTSANEALTQRTAAEQLSISIICHPLCPGKMTIKSATRPVPFAGRVNVKNNARNFPPIRPLSIGVKQPPVCSQMLLVIDGQVRTRWRNVIDGQIE
ncbi:hypothetical protein ABIF38_002874 [Bradyrhizobium japonicum]|uniref:Uncharacterized protein n=1 Tax=Bradyrhizobium elkanii TaxID=29448 RepID=A0ABV4FEQ2_BRAEL|nr:hypothetical protein [Bradyrhizobium elkanii]